MAWEQRKGRSYYYRSRREAGQVRKEYIGTGEFAGALARLDELDRTIQKLRGYDERDERERLEAGDAALQEFCDLTELLARTALEAAGYHQHARGEWRRKRG